MKVYRFNYLENGNILLEKVVIDMNNYNIEDKENGDKLLIKNKNINIYYIDELKNYNFKKSELISCSVNGENNLKLKYRSILDYIYNLINDGEIIIQNTKINIKPIEKTDEGFTYYEHLGISIQCVGISRCLHEILYQCIENNIHIKLKIKTIDDKIIKININNLINPLVQIWR